MSHKSFTSLNIQEKLLKSLSLLDFTQMTPIQEQSIPLILQGEDLVAKSKTGSGKTIAFGIGLLQNLDVKDFHIQSLVICPTRELSEQVASELRKLARSQHNVKIATIYGGDSFANQKRSLEKGAHIVVGTPGRIIDHIGKESIDLSRIKILVLDEADRMLDMGFFDDISYIKNKLPSKLQILLFSATYPENIKKLVSSIMNTPKIVTIEEDNEKFLKQFICKVNKNSKYETLKIILLSYRPDSVIIFCNTKLEVEELTHNLYSDGFDSEFFHGGMEQNIRNEMLLMFANKSIPILVTTNLAARGIDIKDISLVINYDIPHDPEVYLHRVGRTARAGDEGVSISLYDDYGIKHLNAVKELIKTDIEELDVKELSYNDRSSIRAKYVTLHLLAGKRDKIRAGDIVGTFIKTLDLEKNSLGDIDIFQKDSYVAIKRECFDKKIPKIKEMIIKGKRVRIFVL
ncbi:ATP-dependent RNA helicase DbpA [Sulfurimonas sp. HSL-1716]|uniref:ATP-dependent RNA helicase DbpA n=1 Tax=Hydrocurvibacter sulfurireducens TaxID=3131937 RepID=UPI0031F8DDFC